MIKTIFLSVLAALCITAYAPSVISDVAAEEKPNTKVLTEGDIADLPTGVTAQQLIARFGPPISMEKGPFMAWPKQRAYVSSEYIANSHIFIGSGYWFWFKNIREPKSESRYVLTLVASFPEGKFADESALWGQVEHMTVDWPPDDKGKIVKSIFDQ